MADYPFKPDFSNPRSPVLRRSNGATEGLGGATLLLAGIFAELQRLNANVQNLEVAIAAIAAGSVSTAPGTAETSAPAPGLVNLNTATEAELDALDGVGPASVAKIVAARPFDSLADAEERVSDLHWAEFRDRVTV